MEVALNDIEEGGKQHKQYNHIVLNGLEEGLKQHKEEMKADIIKYVGFQPGRDSPSDVRNALLVFAALIATITFDKGTDPPDNLKHTKTTFLLFNTLGFSASMAIIEFCAQGFPFQRELRISITAVGIAYCVGAYPQVDGPVAVTLLYLAISIPYLSRVIPRLIQKWLHGRGELSIGSV